MSIKKEFNIPQPDPTPTPSPDTVIVTDKGDEFSIGEIQHSKRIVKSATPKGDLSWYVKWISSMFILMAVMMRAQDGDMFQTADRISSLIGCLGWTWVGLLWKDRALIILNAIIVFVPISTFRAIFQIFLLKFTKKSGKKVDFTPKRRIIVYVG